MIEAVRPCTEFARQLHAVEKAGGNPKRTLVHDHMDHCLDAGSEADRVDLKVMVRQL